VIENTHRAKERERERERVRAHSHRSRSSAEEFRLASSVVFRFGECKSNRERTKMTKKSGNDERTKEECEREWRNGELDR
jgi:hypothetical protein